MKKYCISAFVASNVGKRRLNNEDNFYVNGQTVNSLNDAHASISDTSSFIGAVCDGMGGEVAGEVASQIAVKTVGDFEKCLINENCSNSIIEETINHANEKICNEMSKCKKRMGTTFTLIGFKNNTVTLSNIGDSRIYRYSNGFFEQISHDHTEAQCMVDAGMVTKEQSMKLKEKHRLTQHLGIFPYEMIIEPYTVRIDAKAEDKYLLCSDGLTDMLTEQEIEMILRKNLSLENTVNSLIDFALKKGGRDNVTVLICEILESENDNKNNAIDAVSSTFDIDDINCKEDNTSINNNSTVKSKLVTLNKKYKSIIILIVIVCVIVVLISALLGYGISKKGFSLSEKRKTDNDTIQTYQTTELITEADYVTEFTSDVADNIAKIDNYCANRLFL